MKEKQKINIDIPVDGMEGKVISIPRLMKSYRGHKNSHPRETLQMLEYAFPSRNQAVSLELARRLITDPNSGADQQGRYVRAEKMLYALMDPPEASDALTAEAAFALSGLYDLWKRPVGAVAMLLRARRLGCEAVTEEALNNLKRKLSQLDIHAYGENPKDAYELGVELSFQPTSFRFAELFLREAAASGNGKWKARACLALAELYERSPVEGQALQKEIARLYREAERNGFPDYINGTPKTAANSYARAL